MVGDYHDAAGSHGFLLDCGVFTPIDVPFVGASNTSPLGINDMGQIVGDFRAGDGNVGEFVLDLGERESSGLNDIEGNSHNCAQSNGGTYTLLEQLPCFCAQPYGINNRGEIVGRATPHGFLLVDGVYTSIDVPGGSETAAFGINSRGAVVGFYTKLGLNGVPSAPIGFLAVPSGSQ